MYGRAKTNFRTRFRALARAKNDNACDGIGIAKELASRTVADDKDHWDDFLLPLVPKARTGYNYVPVNPEHAQDCPCIEDHAAVTTEHQSKREARVQARVTSVSVLDKVVPLQGARGGDRQGTTACVKVCVCVRVCVYSKTETTIKEFRVSPTRSVPTGGTSGAAATRVFSSVDRLSPPHTEGRAEFCSSFVQM